MNIDILDFCVKLLVATFLGCILGIERERWGKAAGMRTFALLIVGSSLFTFIAVDIFPSLIPSGTTFDMAPVLQGIIVGLGFVGSGVIFQQVNKNQITGLTTAAAVWCAGAIGVLVGVGQYVYAALAALVVLAILELLGHIQIAPTKPQEKIGEEEKKN